MNDVLFAERFQPGIEQTLTDQFQLVVYIDGRFVSGENARLSVWDHAVLYGDGVFEGIRAYGGSVFHLDAHLARLFDSAKALALTIPLTMDELTTVILETVRRNRLQDAHIRAIVTRGAGKPGLDPRRSVQASVIVMAYPFPPQLGDKAVRLIISSVRRKSPHAVDSKIKSLNYLDNILAKIQATAMAADDAIMLDISGCVAEATGENIFVVKHGALLTPPPTAALPGITRATVIELAARLGYTTREAQLTPGDLYIADEVFLTGTGSEIVPVAQVDGRSIGAGAPGPITRQIRTAYNECVVTEHITPAYEQKE